jgi:hypothetical protein
MMLFGLLFGTLLNMISASIKTNTGVGVEPWHLMLFMVLTGCLCLVYWLWSNRDPDAVYRPSGRVGPDPLVRFTMTHPTDLPFV